MPAVTPVMRAIRNPSHRIFRWLPGALALSLLPALPAQAADDAAPAAAAPRPAASATATATARATILRPYRLIVTPAPDRRSDRRDAQASAAGQPADVSLLRTRERACRRPDGSTAPIAACVERIVDLP